MIKESVLQEEVTILNVCAPNNRSSNYMRQNGYNCNEREKNPLSQLETSTPLIRNEQIQQAHESVRTQLNSTAPPTSWV